MPPSFASSLLAPMRAIERGSKKQFIEFIEFVEFTPQPFELPSFRAIFEFVGLKNRARELMRSL